jgi:transcriptional regulator with XRE-family HTH domain
MTVNPLPSLPVDRRSHRLKMGLTLKQAAAEIGVSARTYLRWEQGATPNPGNLRRYSAQLQEWERKVQSNQA